MAAAAYYQQLSLSFGGAPIPGMSPAQCLQMKECQTPSQIAATLASNPYLFQSLASPPCSVNGVPSPFTPIPIQRYLPQESPYMNNSVYSNALTFNHVHNNTNSQRHVFSSNAQNGLRSHEELGDRLPDKCRNNVRAQQTVNENSFLPSNYANLPSNWHMNQLHNIKKGKLRLILSMSIKYLSIFV